MLFQHRDVYVTIKSNDVIPLLHLVGSRINEEELDLQKRKKELEEQYVQILVDYAKQSWFFRLMFNPPNKEFYMSSWLYSPIPRLKEIQKLLGSSGWSEIHLSESDWRLLKDLNRAG